ncbi:MAG: hypothetical protein V4621_07855 [Pseudomonadota bacterium]
MTNEERRARIAQVRAEEIERGELSLWWLSFADGDKPKGDTFLGVVILEAYGMGDAINRSISKNINPGGEVMAFLIDPDFVPGALRNRLLQKRDLAGFGVSTLDNGSLTVK